MYVTKVNTKKERKVWRGPMVGVYELTKVTFLHPHILIIQSSTLSLAFYELATTHFIYKKPFFFSSKFHFLREELTGIGKWKLRFTFSKPQKKKIQHKFLRFAFSIQQLGLSYHDVLIGELMT